MKATRATRIAPSAPAASPERCAACTTPTRCKTPALGTKGIACVGRAAGPDDCDCFNACGDDPWLKDGRSQPCARRKEDLRREAMDQHGYDVRWTYVVPPGNTRRLVITQRQGGPFRDDSLRLRGFYYVSIEQLDPATSRWIHVDGSTRGAFPTFDTAHQRSSDIWFGESQQ